MMPKGVRGSVTFCCAGGWIGVVRHKFWRVIAVSAFRVW